MTPPPTLTPGLRVRLANTTRHGVVFSTPYYYRGALRVGVCWSGDTMPTATDAKMVLVATERRKEPMKQTKETQTPVQSRLLARARGGSVSRPMPVPGLANSAKQREADAKALDASLANKPLKPPGRKVSP